MKRPNPLRPDTMTPGERRAELCGLLALGLIRLHQRDTAKPIENKRENSLHFSAHQCLHAPSTQRRTA